MFWRDIPSQVIAKRGRDVIKVKLSTKFQSAIHRAAMRAGKGRSDLYLVQWRRESRPCRGELSELACEAANLLESEYSTELLERMIKHKGQKVEVETVEPLSGSGSNHSL